MSLTAKVYSSSIIPRGEKLEGVGKNQMIASSHSIEVVHIAFFIIIILFIFKMLWREAKLKA